jgi:BirA family biotin operon repressor/biotin-[acetyl-CoA-carboxylase] ligase
MVKWISDNLKTEFIGKKIFYFKEINSTNEFAKRLIDFEKKEGTVVISESQLDLKYGFFLKGGVYLSIILKPKISLLKTLKINLITQISISSTLEKLLGLESFLKWPKEIVLNNKKIAEIFPEIYHNFLILGVWINTNTNLKNIPENFRNNLTTLKKELLKEISNYRVIRAFLKEFEENYLILKEGKEKQILENWKTKNWTLQKRLKIISGKKEIRGRAIDLDEDGFLLVETKNGKIEKIKKGEIFYLPTLVRNENS